MLKSTQQSEYPELFEFLLPLADKPEPDAFGHLLLHRAARGREAALVRRVLEIERPFCDASGRDPLMVAIEGGRSENALLLLPHCDLLAVDALGESALDKARLNGLEEVEREIRMRLRAQLEAGFLSQHVAPLAARPALSL